MNWHCLKHYHAYSISFILSNVVIFFFWSLILKDCIEVQEKKKKVVLLFTSSAKTLNKALPRSSRALTGKICTKSVMHVQSCCFAYFLPFSLMSPSSLLKLPIYYQRRDWNHLPSWIWHFELIIQMWILFCLKTIIHLVCPFFISPGYYSRHKRNLRQRLLCHLVILIHVFLKIVLKKPGVLTAVIDLIK